MTDWNNAPYWAQYFAIEKSGKGFWFKSRPIKSLDFWISNDIIQYVGEFRTNNWEESLTQRSN